MKFSILTTLAGKQRGFVACLLVLFILVGCASQTANRNNAKGFMARGEEAFKDENYLTALEQFRQVKNRYPYSAKAVEAELRIADTYFAQESFIEAEAAYEIFREMHPAYPRIDYVQYRIGLSFYHQIPSNSARDLTAAHRSIEAFNLLFVKSPSSKHKAKAREFVKKARGRLAEHEDYVANFYFQREHYLSSSYRYASLLRNYFGLGYDEQSLYRLGVCYYHTRMFMNSRDALRRLLQKFPESSFKGKAQALLTNMEKKTQTP